MQEIKKGSGNTVRQTSIGNGRQYQQFPKQNDSLINCLPSQQVHLGFSNNSSEQIEPKIKPNSFTKQPKYPV